MEGVSTWTICHAQPYPLFQCEPNEKGKKQSTKVLRKNAAPMWLYLVVSSVSFFLWVINSVSFAGFNVETSSIRCKCSIALLVGLFYLYSGGKKTNRHLRRIDNERLLIFYFTARFFVIHMPWNVDELCQVFMRLFHRPNTQKRTHGSREKSQSAFCAKAKANALKQ